MTNSGGLANRLVSGALAGLVATWPTTAFMRRAHSLLPPNDRYPLPPREIVGAVAPTVRAIGEPATTLLAHFAYGAACGAALSAASEKTSVKAGMAEGVAIWLASYMGWIPAAGLLKPADRHPKPRNSIMIAAHLIWGAAFAIAASELTASDKIFRAGPLKDVSPT
jgi:hypothetical protein